MTPEERDKEREREREKMPFIVATHVYACSPRAAYALRSDQLKDKPYSCFIWGHCRMGKLRYQAIKLDVDDNGKMYTLHCTLVCHSF